MKKKKLAAKLAKTKKKLAQKETELAAMLEIIEQSGAASASVGKAKLRKPVAAKKRATPKLPTKKPAVSKSAVSKTGRSS